ncbi:MULTISPECIES: type II toxin-antitoxin system HicA family toxin [unclassified Pseudomonas]|uniref:type II toxin-antitoxin system HicA family toxin n=1 Tax=unclassified Pseudomonas TaxID=196821 RepID=UPI000A1EE5C5|nr:MULTISPECIES: type II toxin-antitoxin system HicA family toxin [unclassified Pseudomonas]
MNNHQRSTLEVIFKKPVPKSLEWARLESFLISIGATTVEGRGSRVRFELNGAIATFHRPHPDKDAKSYQVRSARQFLEQAGVTP